MQCLIKVFGKTYLFSRLFLVKPFIGKKAGHFPFVLLMVMRFYAKPSLKILFQDRKLKLSASVWKRILWNLTKFQLDQETDRKNENKNFLNELNELKFCEVSRNSFSNRCWKFQLSILKNKKVLFLKNI